MVNGLLRWLEKILEVDLSKPCRKIHVGAWVALEKEITWRCKGTGRIRRGNFSGRGDVEKRGELKVYEEARGRTTGRGVGKEFGEVGFRRKEEADRRLKGKITGK